MDGWTSILAPEMSFPYPDTITSLQDLDTQYISTLPVLRIVGATSHTSIQSSISNYISVISDSTNFYSHQYIESAVFL